MPPGFTVILLPEVDHLDEPGLRVPTAGEDRPSAGRAGRVPDPSKSRLPRVDPPEQPG